MKVRIKPARINPHDTLGKCRGNTWWHRRTVTPVYWTSYRIERASSYDDIGIRLVLIRKVKS